MGPRSHRPWQPVSCSSTLFERWCRSMAARRASMQPLAFAARQPVPPHMLMRWGLAARCTRDLTRSVTSSWGFSSLGISILSLCLCVFVAAGEDFFELFHGRVAVVGVVHFDDRSERTAPKAMYLFERELQIAVGLPWLNAEQRRNGCGQLRSVSDVTGSACTDLHLVAPLGY